MDWKQSRFLRITVGAVAFGVLMGFSQTLDPVGARVLVAALAGSVLGIMIVSNQRRR